MHALVYNSTPSVGVGGLPPSAVNDYKRIKVIS